MQLIAVNRQTCIRDGLCSAVCPMKIIEFDKSGYPTPSAAAEELCIRCGHCVTVCPDAKYLILPGVSKEGHSKFRGGL